MTSYVLKFDEIDQTQVAIVGGKGAHLGELSRIEGVRVPAGFCVTTDAFQRIMAAAPSIETLLQRLSRVAPDAGEAIRAASGELRAAIEAIAMPPDVATSITRSLAQLGERDAYAVRSSATAEDLPTASFAGQQDTYLNVVGPATILQHVSRCWASLFTERAVTYRARNGIDHRKVQMAVVVQRMVFPHAAGILFTADPVTGNRTVTSIDASFGLGEALVGGLVNADVYKVQGGEIVAKTIATKKLAIRATPSGGTREEAIAPERQEQPALTDAQVLRLAQLGRRIEAHFGRPQDIEWCLVDDDFQIVQSRPITTLFPVPAAADEAKQVYVSVGHQQMMTDPFKPLGLAVWQMTAPRPMAEAGGRLFVDVTPMLASPASRANLIGLLGKSDPLIGDALRTVVARDFVPSRPDEESGWAPPGVGHSAIATDPALVAELIARSEALIATLKQDISTRTGSALLDFIAAHIQEMKGMQSDPRSLQVIMAGMEANWWLNDKLQEWLGEKNVADTLTQSVANNVTSEMGLALLDVADVIRAHPKVVAFLERWSRDGAVERSSGGGDDVDRSTAPPLQDALSSISGGREARDAIVGWLEKYGMRGVGEIDITRPRWSERPSMLVPILLGHIANFEPGAGKRRFEQGREEARRKEDEILERLRALPDGEQKAHEAKRMIDRVRTFAGYREYPKYFMVSRYFVYKQGLMREADRLVQAGVLRERDDVFYLRFDELKDVIRTQKVDERLIAERKEAFRSYEQLAPPGVLTSEGEAVAGSYRREDLPSGALVGLAVSAGTVEGRARVVLDLAKADLEPGDILVTAFTDPSWTPLFVSIKGLVTEVGGLMTHGAVIAREYGLPAVVGVVNATRLIRDGQRIRVNGTDGHVEVLS